MTNYSLAKQLKDAGFPFVDHTCDQCEENMMSCGNSVLPRLSELLEACGKHRKYYLEEPFDLTIQGTSDGWAAGYTDPNYHESWEDFENGSTPEEAVARLWLVLQA